MVILPQKLLGGDYLQRNNLLYAISDTILYESDTFLYEVNKSYR